MTENKSLFYRDMKDWEIETYKLITGKAKGIYFSKEAAKYLKHVIDCGTIIDSKGDK